MFVTVRSVCCIFSRLKLKTWNVELMRSKIFDVLIMYFIFIYISFSKSSYHKGERNPSLEQDMGSY